MQGSTLRRALMLASALLSAAHAQLGTHNESCSHAEGTCGKAQNVMMTGLPPLLLDSDQGPAAARAAPCSGLANDDGRSRGHANSRHVLRGPRTAQRPSHDCLYDVTRQLALTVNDVSTPSRASARKGKVPTFFHNRCLTRCSMRHGNEDQDVSTIVFHGITRRQALTVNDVITHRRSAPKNSL